MGLWTNSILEHNAYKKKIPIPIFCLPEIYAFASVKHFFYCIKSAYKIKRDVNLFQFDELTLKIALIQFVITALGRLNHIFTIF